MGYIQPGYYSPKEYNHPYDSATKKVGTLLAMTALVSQTTKPRPKSYFGRQIWGHPLYKWQDKNLLPDIRKLFQLRLKYMTLNFREAEELSTNQQSAIPVVLESLPRPKPDPEQDAK